jgi:diguanylate cyclase (GGDEF)-like protein
MTILIVDDLQDNRDLLTAVLTVAGYRDVVAVPSALEALKRLKEGGVDLILMDVMMPHTSGIEACRLIKADESLRDIPIIMVTGRKDHEVLESAFAAGAMDFIGRPIDNVELVARVRSALLLKREMDVRKSRERELLEVTRQLEEANETLQRLSSLDGLTGLANRRRLDEFLDLEWRRALRDRDWLSALMVDIDFFKAFNDAHGHQAGDDCLRRVAEVLSGVSQRPGDLAARYGGEEFVVVLTETDLDGALAVAETLRSRVEGLGIANPESHSGVVTVSVGVAAVVPAPRSAVADLIEAADRALYGAKGAGRNRVALAGPAPAGVEPARDAPGQRPPAA